MWSVDNLEEYPWESTPINYALQAHFLKMYYCLDTMPLLVGTLH